MFLKRTISKHSGAALTIRVRKHRVDQGDSRKPCTSFPCLLLTDLHNTATRTNLSVASCTRRHRLRLTHFCPSDDYVFALARKDLLGFKPTLTSKKGFVIDETNYEEGRRWVWLFEFLVSCRVISLCAHVDLEGTKSTTRAYNSVENWFRKSGGSYIDSEAAGTAWLRTAKRSSVQTRNKATAQVVQGEFGRSNNHSLHR